MLPKPNDRFDWAQAGGRTALVCRSLEPHAQNFVTTRQWPLGRATADDREAAWTEVARAIGIEPPRLKRLHQVHGVAVVVHRRDQTSPLDPTPPLPHADIVVSNDASVALAVQSADCVPLLIADRRTGVVAAAHAGWRGLAAGVPRITVRALGDAFGSRPGDLVAAIGPSICAQHYEVDTVVRDAFSAAGHSPAQISRWFLNGVRPAHWQFDGWASTRDQLEASGIPANQIATAGLCTASHPDLFCSYRRDGASAGRIAAVIRSRS